MERAVSYGVTLLLCNFFDIESDDEDEDTDVNTKFKPQPILEPKVCLI